VPAFVGCKVLEALPIRTGEERVAAALFEGVWEGAGGLREHNRDRAVVTADHLCNATVRVTELARPYYALPLVGR